MANYLSSWFASENITSVSWENRAIDAPDTTSTVPWARVTFFPGQTQQATVGDTGYNLMHGILLVNLFYAKGFDTGAVNEAADSLMTYFRRGTITPEVSGYSARINNVWRTRGLEEARWYNLPVNINYFQYVVNS